MGWFGGYGYGAGCYGGGYYGGYGQNNSFTLLVVLFVLLIIVGTVYPIGGYGE